MHKAVMGKDTESADNYLASGASSNTYCLCDLGQLISPLCLFPYLEKRAIIEMIQKLNKDLVSYKC